MHVAEKGFVSIIVAAVRCGKKIGGEISKSVLDAMRRYAVHVLSKELVNNAEKQIVGGVDIKMVIGEMVIIVDMSKNAPSAILLGVVAARVGRNVIIVMSR